MPLSKLSREPKFGNIKLLLPPLPKHMSVAPPLTIHQDSPPHTTTTTTKDHHAPACTTTAQMSQNISHVRPTKAVQLLVQRFLRSSFSECQYPLNHARPTDPLTPNLSNLLPGERAEGRGPLTMFRNRQQQWGLGMDINLVSKELETNFSTTLLPWVVLPIQRQPPFPKQQGPLVVLPDCQTE